MLSGKRIHLLLLVIVLVAAGVGFRLSRQPSSAARDAAVAESEPMPMPAPQTALEEHMQQARSYARQLLPRTGPTRYPSADDYLWIKVKDCYQDRTDMLAHRRPAMTRAPAKAMPSPRCC